MIEAARPSLIGLRIDRRGTGKRVPAELCRRARHHVRKFGAAQRRHRIVALARSFENIAALIDPAADIAGLSRHADLMFDDVVSGLQLIETEGPVLDRRAFGNACGTVAARRLAPDLEIPRIEPPALRPIMQRGPADRVHHRMDGWPRRIRRRCVRPVGRHFMRKAEPVDHVRLAIIAHACAAVSVR